MEKGIEFHISGIKCDHCDYKDESVQVKDYIHWLNKPCPKCGANLLTQADYDNVQLLLASAAMVNEMFAAGLLPEAETEQRGRVEMDGTGAMKIHVEGEGTVIIKDGQIQSDEDEDEDEDVVTPLTPLKMRDLEACVAQAKAYGMSFIGVAFELPGTEDVEFIINPSCNFDTKLKYYKETYDEDLNHKKAPGVKIVDFTYGHSFTDIQASMLG